MSRKCFLFGGENANWPGFCLLCVLFYGYDSSSFCFCARSVAICTTFFYISAKSRLSRARMCVLSRLRCLCIWTARENWALKWMRIDLTFLLDKNSLMNYDLSKQSFLSGNTRLTNSFTSFCDTNDPRAFGSLSPYTITKEHRPRNSVSRKKLNSSR